MIYLILVIVIVSIRDIKDLRAKSKKKDLYIYVFIMLLVGTLGIYYFANPDRDSFSIILLSLIGKEG